MWIRFIYDMYRSEQKSLGGLSESLDLNHIFSKIQENLKIPLKKENMEQESCEKKDTRNIKMEIQSG